MSTHKDYVERSDEDIAKSDEILTKTNEALATGKEVLDKPPPEVRNVTWNKYLRSLEEKREEKGE